MKNLNLIIILLVCTTTLCSETCSTIFGQSYTSYFTGDTTNAVTNPSYLVCLMGGATEDDLAMKKFLLAANGGDILVLRHSGSNGYNDYMYTDLGITVNSVETIKFNNIGASTDPYVLRRISEAEAIWFAGGDQNLYRIYFDNTPIENLLDIHVNTKKASIGGTSAGMAIMGQYYFTAQNGSISSGQALANPDGNLMTLRESFIRIPELQNTITDTHYDRDDSDVTLATIDTSRLGRHITFLAVLQDSLNLPSEQIKGIACNEYVACVFDSTGIVTVYGSYPQYQEFAHFLHVACTDFRFPVIQTDLATGLQFTMGISPSAAQLRVNAKAGLTHFDLSTWRPIEINETKRFGWEVENGILQAQNSDVVNDGFHYCAEFLSLETIDEAKIAIFPNPTSHILNISSTFEINKIIIRDLNGKIILEKTNSNSVNVKNLSPGTYQIELQTSLNQVLNKLFVKQ